MKEKPYAVLGSLGKKTPYKAFMCPITKKTVITNRMPKPYSPFANSFLVEVPVKAGKIAAPLASVGKCKFCATTVYASKELLIRVNELNCIVCGTKLVKADYQDWGVTQVDDSQVPTLPEPDIVDPDASDRADLYGTNPQSYRYPTLMPDADVMINDTDVPNNQPEIPEMGTIASDRKAYSRNQNRLVDRGNLLVNPDLDFDEDPDEAENKDYQSRKDSSDMNYRDDDDPAYELVSSDESDFEDPITDNNTIPENSDEVFMKDYGPKSQEGASHNLNNTYFRDVLGYGIISVDDMSDDGADNNSNEGVDTAVDSNLTDNSTMQVEAAGEGGVTTLDGSDEFGNSSVDENPGLSDLPGSADGFADEDYSGDFFMPRENHNDDDDDVKNRDDYDDDYDDDSDGDNDDYDDGDDDENSDDNSDDSDDGDDDSDDDDSGNDDEGNEGDDDDDDSGDDNSDDDDSDDGDDDLDDDDDDEDDDDDDDDEDDDDDDDDEDDDDDDDDDDNSDENSDDDSGKKSYASDDMAGEDFDDDSGNQSLASDVDDESTDDGSDNSDGSDNDDSEIADASDDNGDDGASEVYASKNSKVSKIISAIIADLNGETVTKTKTVKKVGAKNVLKIKKGLSGGKMKVESSDKDAKANEPAAPTTSISVNASDAVPQTSNFHLSRVDNNCVIVVAADNGKYLPVFILDRTKASKTHQPMFDNINTLSTAFSAVIAASKTKPTAETFHAFGSSPITYKVPIAEVVASEITKGTVSATASLAEEKTNLMKEMRQCIGIAALEIMKNINQDNENPVRNVLAHSLKRSGVRKPESVIDSAFVEAGAELMTKILDRAVELKDQSLATRNEIARYVSQARVNPVPTSSKGFVEKLASSSLPISVNAFDDSTTVDNSTVAKENVISMRDVVKSISFK